MITGDLPTFDTENTNIDTGNLQTLYGQLNCNIGVQLFVR